MDYSLYLFNGISYGMLLFTLASGLTLILGVMKTLNLAHGTFFLLGFYTAQWVIRLTNNFFLGAVAGAFAAGIIGMAVQRFLLSRVPADPSPQTLLTVGIIYVFQDIFLMISKGRIWMLPKPHFLAGSIPFGGLTFPTYRIALTAMGCIIFVLLWLFIRKTKWGAILRAGADKPKIAEAVGINIPLVWVMVFGLGIFIAGLAGVLAGPIWGAFPGGEWDILVFALIIILLAGMGSLHGAFVMSLVVGMITNVGHALFPEMAMFLLFALVVIVMLVRPRGIFGGIKY
jgi:branched-chain amino acid transport system permease protein